MFKDLNILDRVKVLRYMQSLGITDRNEAILLYDTSISLPDELLLYDLLLKLDDNDIISVDLLNKKLSGGPIKQRLDFTGNWLSRHHPRRKNIFRGHGDLARYYMGLPLLDNVLYYSQYKPTKAKNPNATYIAIKDLGFINDIVDAYNDPENWTDKEKNIKNGYFPPFNGKFINDYTLNDLGEFILTSGIDPKKGQYISYYDIWDAHLNANNYDGKTENFGSTKPFEVYDRIYLDDYYGIDSTPEPGIYYGGYISPVDIVTNKYSKGGHTIHINPANKGKFNATKKRTGKTTEELTHSKNPITRKRAISALNAKHWSHKHDDGGNIIWDNNGQWSHPGQVTGITGSPFGTDITMKGVADYLYGVDEYGNVDVMAPGQEYYFPGLHVVEYPITSHKAQYGEQLSTYVPLDKLDYMQTVWDYMGERNVNPYNRAAIMGNIMKESSFNPKAKNPESSAYGLFQMIDSLRNKANKWMDSLGIKDKDLGLIDWYLHLMNDNIDDYMDEYNNFMYRWDKVKQQYKLHPSKQNKEYINQYQDYYNNTYKKRVDNNEMWSVEDLNRVMSDSLSPLDERTKMFERVFEKAGKGSEYEKRVKYAYDILDYFYPDHVRIDAMRQDPLNYVDNVFQYDDQGLPLQFQHGGRLVKPFSYLPIPIVRF